MQVNACWVTELTLPQSLHVLKDLARMHLLNGGPIGLQILDLVEKESWSEIVNFDLDQTAEWDVLHLINCRQGLGFFKKFEKLEIGVNKTSVAELKFIETERLCRETNAYLKAPTDVLSKHPAAVLLFEVARRKIRRVLGACPKAGKLKFHFGPGATTAIRKTAAVPEAKFASGFQCSSSMLASGQLPEYLRQVPHWLDAFDLANPDYLPEVQERRQNLYSKWERETLRGSINVWQRDSIEGVFYAPPPPSYSVVDVEIVPGKLTVVPKSAKEKRTILVEPNLNGFVQQGIRHAMEKRLKAAGLSTNDQSRNQRMARRGSITDELATIDLSSASDLISYELVKLLLPSDWFSLLLSARTGAAETSWGCVPLDKFSSMGNAYTFPLETLIFWAITTSAPYVFNEEPFKDDDVAVFGDDIIIPSRGYKHVAWALGVSGFKLNPNKSFPKGPFRESCGTDYYRGIDVRPYHQEDLVSGQTLFVLHNHYFRLKNFEMAAAVLQYIPESLRLFGPDGYGDGHLLSTNWPRRRKAKWSDKGYDGAFFETYSLRARRSVARYPGDWVSPLYTIYVSGRGPIHEGVPIEEAPMATRFGKDGRPIWTYPGSSGYKKVSIYTLHG